MHDHIETIEAGYEFLLAYAAQGRETDAGGSGPSEVRQTLEGMAGAAEAIASEKAAGKGTLDWVIADDAKKAHAAISLVLEQDGIGSEIVDNLNASIHLRALLTDLFLYSETTAG